MLHLLSLIVTFLVDMHCGQGSNLPPPPPPRGELSHNPHSFVQYPQMNGGYFGGLAPQFIPPGVWTPGHTPHHSGHDFGRSRSPRRSRHEDVAAVLAQMSRSDFKRVFNGLPADLRSVAFECFLTRRPGWVCASASMICAVNASGL